MQSFLAFAPQTKLRSVLNVPKLSCKFYFIEWKVEIMTDGYDRCSRLFMNEDSIAMEMFFNPFY